MKACVLKSPAAIEARPLEYRDVATPVPADDEVLVRVNACGVCRTDLHIVEGELLMRRSPLIPGHQVVGTTPDGSRVGVAWLHRTDGVCKYCRSGQENLCDRAAFTGYSVDGGYAEYLTAPRQFVYAIPDGFSDRDAAPLLCAGIIGYRSLRLSGVTSGARLGMYGFGAAAHVAIQVARHWGVQVYAFTRGIQHQRLALELGATWAGTADQSPPQPLDAAIIFAPAGELVPKALSAVRKGGTVALGGIHMSPIPSIAYDLLYGERVLRSVANNTREDGIEFLKIAAEIPIHTKVQLAPLDQANEVLLDLKNGSVNGAAVLAP